MPLLPDVCGVAVTQLAHANMATCLRGMQAVYAVHPTRLLKAWVVFLRLSEPEVYGRVEYCERLANMNLHFAGGRPPAPPQHVLDYDVEH